MRTLPSFVLFSRERGKSPLVFVPPQSLLRSSASSAAETANALFLLRLRRWLMQHTHTHITLPFMIDSTGIGEESTDRESDIYNTQNALIETEKEIYNTQQTSKDTEREIYNKQKTHTQRERRGRRNQRQHSRTEENEETEETEEIEYYYYNDLDDVHTLPPHKTEQKKKDVNTERHTHVPLVVYLFAALLVLLLVILSLLTAQWRIYAFIFLTSVVCFFLSSFFFLLFFSFIPFIYLFIYFNSFFIFCS